MNNKNSSKYPNTDKHQVDVLELIKPYTQSWKWFVASALLALVLAFLSGTVFCTGKRSQKYIKFQHRSRFAYGFIKAGRNEF